jgi:nitrogen-specific signal transduction histidine kinase/CheY-like chemotaxis protein
LYLVGDIEDITDTKEMERRLIQSQKMEAIGSLAGGIAHDFNNLLSPIIGYAELLLSDLPEGSEAHENIGRIHSAGKRAGDLVRQILTFSRSTDSEIKPLKIAPILKEVMQLVRSTIPATIEIKHVIDPRCAMVMADPTQVHQVAMNLITNAYHAMRTTGGAMDVRLENCTIEVGESVGLTLSPGDYVCLTVADTGHGMDSATLSKIFDPYFTTKERGEGTGLGLAVVHGIVRKFNGDVKVTSEIGKGSAFSIYLPAIAVDPRLHPLENKMSVAGGNEHILIVDDEESLDELEQLMLERMGYRITTRTSSVEALKAFRNAPGRYDLVITDMTMPKMTGLALSLELKQIRQDIKIILCTGFSEQIGQEAANQNHIDGFIMKPVVMPELSALVREVLNG